jgi:hypothetical protein
VPSLDFELIVVTVHSLDMFDNPEATLESPVQNGEILQ